MAVTVQDVSDIEMAFPANVSHLMPKMEEIPDEFTSSHGKWQQVFSDLFYRGLVDSKWIPKDGIDPEKAYRHLMCIVGSFEPSHQHKAAACAYLMSQWFEDVKYEAGEPEYLRALTAASRKDAR